VTGLNVKAKIGEQEYFCKPPTTQNFGQCIYYVLERIKKDVQANISLKVTD